MIPLRSRIHCDGSECGKHSIIVVVLVLVVVVNCVVYEGVVVVWPERDLGQNNVEVNAEFRHCYCQDLAFERFSAFVVNAKK